MSDQKERRRGTDRRKNPVRSDDRRKQNIPVKVERRSGKDRRTSDRRTREDRRRSEKP